jgi:broad-specificity NMP kinase
MSPILCVLLWTLLVPLAVILWLSESRQARIKRLRRLGWSHRRIAEHLHCTTYQVRKALA